MFIAISGCFVKLLTLTMQSATEIEEIVSRQSAPAWINDCLSSELQLDFSFIDSNNAELLSVATDLRTISVLMIIVCCQTFLCVCCCLTAIAAHLCDVGHKFAENIRHTPIEVAQMVRYFKEFN